MYKVIVEDSNGEVVFTSSGNTVIAGTSDGDDAAVMFIPSEDESEVAALISTCEDAFAGEDEE